MNGIEKVSLAPGASWTAGWSCTAGPMGCVFSLCASTRELLPSLKVRAVGSGMAFGGISILAPLASSNVPPAGPTVTCTTLSPRWWTGPAVAGVGAAGGGVACWAWLPPHPDATASANAQQAILTNSRCSDMALSPGRTRNALMLRRRPPQSSIRDIFSSRGRRRQSGCGGGSRLLGCGRWTRGSPVRRPHERGTGPRNGPRRAAMSCGRS